FRFGLRIVIHEFRNLGYNQQLTVIVGINERTRHLIEVIQEHAGLGYEILGALDNDAERASHIDGAGVSYLGEVSKLKDMILGNAVDEVYICLPVRSSYEEIQEIAHLCEGAGIPVHMVAD